MKELSKQDYVPGDLVYEITSETDKVRLFLDENKGELTPSTISSLILTGDRLSCCDEAILARDNTNQKVIAVCTMASLGEERSGQPTVVARVVLPEYRRRGIGEQLYIRSISRLRERMERGEISDQRIRIDHISRAASLGMKKLLSKKPELEGLLEIVDSSDGF